jgi:hypothetical protein
MGCVTATCKRRAKQAKSCNAELAGNRHRSIYKALIRVYNRNALTPPSKRTTSTLIAAQ